VSGPAGMVVSATGAVTWAPAVGTPGTYTATVRATNSEGSADLSFAYTIYPADTDLHAPSYPGAITISNVTQTSMTANWTGATDNVGVAGYEISAQSTYCKAIRKCSTTGYKFPNTLGSARSFTLTGLLANRNYTVNIRAFDAVGNYGLTGSSALTATLR